MERRTTAWGRAAYAAVALVALANGGCLLVAAGACAGGAVGYAYCKGKVCQNYVADFNDTWAATHTALAELGMPVVSEERTAAGAGFIESRAADGERIRIYVDNVPSRVPSEGMLTTVGVRIATFGDYSLSDRILYQIGAHLAPAPAPGAPTPAPPALGPIQPTAVSAPAVPTPTGPPPLLPAEPVPVRKP